MKFQIKHFSLLCYEKDIKGYKSTYLGYFPTRSYLNLFEHFFLYYKGKKPTKTQILNSFFRKVKLHEYYPSYVRLSKKKMQCLKQDVINEINL